MILYNICYIICYILIIFYVIGKGVGFHIHVTIADVCTYMPTYTHKCIPTVHICDNHLCLHIMLAHIHIHSFDILLFEYKYEYNYE